MISLASTLRVTLGKCAGLLLFTVCLVAQATTARSQSMTVSASTATISILPGQQNVPVSVTVGGSGYAGPITVTLTGLPAGVSVSPLTLPAGGTGSLNVSASLAAGQEGFMPSSASRNTTWTTPINLVAVAGATQATAQLSLAVSISNPSYVPPAAAIDLPIVNIDTGGVAVVDKVTDVPGTITITSADGQMSYLPNSDDADNTATFHVHGNTTANMPKLPYDVKLNTSLDLLNTMGLDCPYVTGKKAKPTCDKSKSYILLANYDDKSLLRDWAASALANAIPLTSPYLTSPAGSPTPSGTSTLMPWAPHSLFVELFLNGVYEGNYQLIEKIKVDSHRLNISELSEDATEDVTGGYLMEIDYHKDEDFVFTTPGGLPIGLIDPDFAPDPQVPQQNSYISNYVGQAEEALYSSNFTDPTQGWRAYFDEASAVNFYIVNDLMGNGDGGDFYSSDYLYKDVDNPLLYMGPIWDFDGSSGNLNYLPIESATNPWMQIESYWYVRWFKDPSFTADVVKQWNLLKTNGVFSAWLASVAQQGKRLEKSQANNFARWPILGIQVWPNPEAAGTYDGEVQYLTNWLQLRFAYLDTELNGKAATSTTLGIGSGTLRTGAPVTLTAHVSGGTAPSGIVTIVATGVVLGSGPLNNGVAVVTLSNLPAGSIHLQAVYNGDDKNGISSSPDQVVTVLPTLNQATVAMAGPAVLSSGSSISFTATVFPNAGTVIPTGNVAFVADAGAGTNAALNGAGVASFAATALTPGQHTITAEYLGDSTYAPASSAAFAVQVAGFSVASVNSSSASAIASSGHPAIFPLMVAPSGLATLASEVDLSVTGLPGDATASFTPASVAAGSGATPVVLTVTRSTNGSLRSTGMPWGGAALPAVLCMLLLPFAGRMRKSAGRMNRLACLMAVILSGVVLSVGLTGCGVSGVFPQQSYELTVTARSGSLSLTTTVPLIVK